MYSLIVLPFFPNIRRTKKEINKERKYQYLIYYVEIHIGDP
jgi:hypothetical protein